MAQIKRIVRDSPISNFQQGAPSGGGAFRVLADSLNEIYDRVAPVALKKMQAKGDAVGREEFKAQFGDNRPYQAQPSGTGSTDTIAGGSGGDDLSNGANWLEYANQGAIRNKPISEKLKNSMSFLGDMGITMRVISGGETEDRKASNSGRHMDGGAADADFYKGGRKLDWNNPDDLPIFQEIASKARGRGVTGIGAGDDYMGAGRMHLGFGKEAAWGADGKGENAPAWLTAALNGATPSMSGGGGQDTVVGGSGEGGGTYTPPTMVRTSSGALESRLYSPYSGPILQAHNAAARVAYQSEVLNKSAVDLMDMSQQFPLDPDSFSQAAEQYIDTMVDSAPTDYQGELRQTLAKEVQRRTFGMMEDKHRDIRARANNSSQALINRWSDGLTDAILTGDPDQIAEAQGQLDGLLQAREALPGVAWTTEQSANVIIDARKRAVVQAEKRRKEASKETKNTFDLIIKGAKVGATVSGEEILNDPAAIMDHPELAREAAAFVALRDNMPDFLEMTPSEQAAAVAQMGAQEVVEEWQLDIVDAAGKAAKANKKAWDDDPVQRAAEVMKTNPPPPMPELTLDDPGKIVSGLAERREYMNQLREAGYTDTKAFLSKTEAEGLQSAMGSDTPAELRAALAGAIVGGFGADAIAVFDEIDADKITMYAGKMMALGGNHALASTILTGQQMLDEGLVRVPPNADRIDTFSTATATAFEGVPGSIEAQSEVMATAQAIYAADPAARGLEPTSEAATKLMEGSIQKALGQAKNKRGKTTGGVQEIMGNNTLLPIGVDGEKADEVLRMAMTGEITGETSFARGMNALTGGLFGANVSTPSDLWGDGGAPMHNGKPIPPSYVNNGSVRMIPAGPNGYRLEITSGSTRIDAQDADGNVFFFDLKKLMEAAE